MLADDRPTTGRLSADCRPTIGRRLTSCVCLGAVYGHCAHDKDWNIILQRAKLWLTEITVEGLVESLMPVTRCCVCPNSLELSPEACVFKSIEMWENVGLPFRNGYSDSPIMLYLDQKGDAGPCASRIRMHCCASLTLAHLDGQEQIQESRQHCQASPSLPSPAQWHKLTTLASAHLHYIYGCTSAYKDICSKGTITYGSNTVRTVLIQFFPDFAVENTVLVQWPEDETAFSQPADQESPYLSWSSSCRGRLKSKRARKRNYCLATVSFAISARFLMDNLANQKHDRKYDRKRDRNVAERGRIQELISNLDKMFRNEYLRSHSNNCHCKHSIAHKKTWRLQPPSTYRYVNLRLEPHQP